MVKKASTDPVRLWCDDGDQLGQVVLPHPHGTLAVHCAESLPCFT